MSKPTWWNAFGCSATSAFFVAPALACDLNAANSELLEGGPAMERDLSARAAAGVLTQLRIASNQLLKATPKMAHAACAPKLSEAFTTYLKHAHAHVSRLEKTFWELGDCQTRCG